MRGHGRRGHWLIAVATAALASGGLAPADAERGLDSFAGSCSVEGTDTFTPPATNSPQHLTVRYDARGTCTGTLNGRKVSKAPVELHNVSHAYGSCPNAHTTGPGPGAITFADGTTIRYTVEFTSVGTEVDLTFRGQRSGSARGHATFLTPRTPPDVTLKCAGEGAAKVPMDLSLTTDSPLVSGGRKAAAERRDYKAPRIRLASGPRKRCARRSFRARVRISERWSGLRRAQLSLDGRRLVVTGAKRFSRRIRARRLRPGRHRLTVVAQDRAGNRSTKKGRFRSCTR
jgi:hypothetical protein